MAWVKCADILVKGPLNGSYTPLNLVLLLVGVLSSLVLYLRVRNPPRIQLDTAPARLVNGDTIAEEDEE